MIRIEHLTKAFPDITPINDVSVTINEGDVISVIGPSGTGKSTLIRCINLLEKPTSGHIWIDNDEITDPKCDLEKIRRSVGMVFQSFNLFPNRTVIENIMMAPVDLLGKSRQEAYDKGMELLVMVGLEEKAMNYPEELSGGQKQRIAIARTLAMDPEIILMDEPTSALDPTMVGEVQAVIRDLASSGRTMMIVTHEMDFARAICNRVFYLDDGCIYEEGTPEQIFDHPEKEKTIRFVRGLRVLEFDIESRHYDYPGVQGSIEAYCIRHQISKSMMQHVRLAFEETVQVNLIKSLATPIIHVSVSYYPEDESLDMTVDYKGDKYDLLSKCDIISLAVLDTAVSDRSFRYDEEEEYGNHLELKIKP